MLLVNLLVSWVRVCMLALNSGGYKCLAVAAKPYTRDNWLIGQLLLASSAANILINRDDWLIGQMHITPASATISRVFITEDP